MINDTDILHLLYQHPDRLPFNWRQLKILIARRRRLRRAYFPNNDQKSGQCFPTYNIKFGSLRCSISLPAMGTLLQTSVISFSFYS